jgi:hypothetical protein
VIVTLSRLVLILGLAGAVAAVSAKPAAAQACPGSGCECANLTNPVYFQVGDTQTNLMNVLGRALRDNTPNPITLVFVTNGSCTNIASAYSTSGSNGTGSNTPTPVTATMTYIPSSTESPGWELGSANFTCSPGSAGTVPDVFNSAVFNSACTSAAPPADLQITNGPIQAYVMSVPAMSDQTAITAEEAYFVFGFGMAGMISPWTDESEMFIRTTTKSTLITWADSINVPPDKWHGTMFGSSSSVVASLQTAQTPEAAIGILGDEVYDADRSTLHVLAYRTYGQYGAYFPDSTFTAFDKQNLRDGHYFVWSPTVWMNFFNGPVGSGGSTAVNPNAQYIIDLITGQDSLASPAPNFDSPTVVASIGVVPDCAMGVQRSLDAGGLSLYTPPQSCKCKFESIVATTDCATCDGSGGSNTCATGVCRNGYCEAN